MPLPKLIPATVALLLLLFISCTSKKQRVNIRVGLTENKTSLQFRGLDPAIMGEIARDSTGSGWRELVPVYRMPADTDMKTYQPEQPGKYVIADSVVVFTPDSPFIKSQTYFVRWYHLDDNAGPTDYIKGKRKPGEKHFTDLIFKQ